MIKAIETHWKGYRFRSRLEARWAVFFEEMRLDWIYEPQGFEREFIEGHIDRYLPDFQIKIGKTEYWVEVKGNKNYLKENFDLIERLHDWGGVLPGFYCNGENDLVPNGLILLGNIPEPEHGALFFPIIGHRKGVNLYWRLFDPNEGMLKSENLLQYHFGMDSEIILPCDMHGDFQPKIAKTPFGYTNIKVALSAARSARFEHGEKPRVLSWS